MRHRAFFVALAIGYTACGGGISDTTNEQPSIAAGDVRVSVQKTSYSRDEIAPSTGAGVRGTILNTSDRTVYARLGDSFNGAAEQDPVYVANGSDGTLERLDGTGWIPVPGAQLIEGVKEIELHPGHPYTFIAHAPSPAPAGTYRMSVAYRSSPGNVQVTGRAISASFEIR